jgi:hypothetical protein
MREFEARLHRRRHDQLSSRPAPHQWQKEREWQTLEQWLARPRAEDLHSCSGCWTPTTKSSQRPHQGIDGSRHHYAEAENTQTGLRTRRFLHDHAASQRLLRQGRGSRSGKTGADTIEYLDLDHAVLFRRPTLALRLTPTSASTTRLTRLPSSRQSLTVSEVPSTLSGIASRDNHEFASVIQRISGGRRRSGPNHRRHPWPRG